MCELFGLASRLPTGINMSMRILAGHGSRAHHLGDGWGVAFHAGDDALLVKQPTPLEESPWVDFLERQHVHSRMVLAHIRHASQGEIALRNTQPFSRELGGQTHIFAHNGNLSGIAQRFPGGCARFRPVGGTDSEYAFCLLMERMAPLWAAGSVPTEEARTAVFAELAAELRPLGPANVLYTDGHHLFAHGHRRTQPDGRIAAPGLAMLTRTCAVDPEEMANAGIGILNPQAMTLFASVPLTGEPWRPLEEGEIVVASAGDTAGQPVEILGATHAPA